LINISFNPEPNISTLMPKYILTESNSLFEQNYKSLYNNLSKEYENLKNENEKLKSELSSLKNNYFDYKTINERLIFFENI